MPVYTVHAPVAALSVRDAAERLVFVRDGFSFWAFVFGPFWLMSRRLWLALLGWIVVQVVVHLILMRLGVGNGTIVVADFLIALLLGFEAATLLRWRLSRRRWRQVDVVVADDLNMAERRFFDRWTDRQDNFDDEPFSIDRGAPPPPRRAASNPYARPPSGSHEGVIGLFPRAETPR